MYLTPDLDVALTMGGPLVLEVDYDPVGWTRGQSVAIDNYGFNPPPGGLLLAVLGVRANPINTG